MLQSVEFRSTTGEKIKTQRVVVREETVVSYRGEMEMQRTGKVAQHQKRGDTRGGRKEGSRVSQCLPEGAPPQFVPSFAQSSLIKEKLKLCRRSYYCLELNHTSPRLALI